MDSQKNQDSEKAKRVCVRIPANIKAKIFKDNKHLLTVRIKDLSATGIAIFIAKGNLDHDSFQIRFRLSLFAKEIRSKILVKNTIKLDSGLRLGCVFEKILPADKKTISNHTSEHNDYLSVSQAVNLSAFLCLADVLFRGTLSIVVGYYLITKLGVEFSEMISDKFHILSLILYSLLSSLALIFSDKMLLRWGTKFLTIAIFCLIPAFAFILYKCFSYWINGIFASGYDFISIFFGLYCIFAFYVGASILKAIVSLKKIKTTMTNEGIHRIHT